MPRFHVQFEKESVVTDRYGIQVEADSLDEALTKVTQWGAGEIDLEDAEAETETHEREVETHTSEFTRVLPPAEQGFKEPVND